MNMIVSGASRPFKSAKFVLAKLTTNFHGNFPTCVDMESHVLIRDPKVANISCDILKCLKDINSHLFPFSQCRNSVM